MIFQAKIEILFNAFTMYRITILCYCDQKNENQFVLFQNVAFRKSNVFQLGSVENNMKL